MLNNVKALIVVLVLAAAVFYVAKKYCLRYISNEDFDRRRAVWIAHTCFAFLSPNIYFYAMIATPLLLWAGRKDPNPAALFLLLLYSAPYAEIFVPRVFTLTPQRLMVMVVLIPALMRKAADESSRTGTHVRSGFAMADFLIIVYCLLRGFLTWPKESTTLTSALRECVVACLDIAIPYLAMRWRLNSEKKLQEALVCFALCCAIMVPIAIFEAQRSWLLYVGVASKWGSSNDFAFLMRGGVLRSQVATGHSLTLGYVFAISFGVCLYLQRNLKPRIAHLLTALFMWAGLVAAYSRGPWLVAVLLMFVYFLQMPSGLSRTFKAALVLACVGAIFAATPLGERMASSLPFIGTVDSENVEYRNRLLETSLQVIPDHPWFGDMLVLQKMESLRQGQGIIDIVNGYLFVALFYGLVTLAIVLSILLASILRAWIASRRIRRSHPDLSMLGACLVACVVSTLLFIWTAGFVLHVWVLVGIAMGYADLVRRINFVPAGRARRRQIAP